MNDINNIKSIIDSLNTNPMFRLSLGSKELFHSNFLEFLWEQNPRAFLEMLKEMVSKEEDKKQIKDLLQELKKDKEYLILAREKEHFDICIFHHNERNKIVYDIIIENKVKSIPYRAQLDGYDKKIQERQEDKAIYILLTLVRDFAQKDKILNWNLVNYDKLETYIKMLYLKKSFKTRVDKYIEDYCSYLSYINKLGIEEIIKNGNHELQSQTYDLLKGIRLHDLYIKLTGSFFIEKLYEIIKTKINKESIITFGKEDRDDTEHHIFLSSSYNNGKCTISAAIRKDSIFYIIQIEGNPFDGKDGNQYRHMINKVNLAENSKKRVETKKRTEIDSKLLKKNLTTAQEAITFMEFSNPFEVKDVSGPLSDYCKYEPHVVYKYKTFDDRDFDKKLDIMAKDLIDTYHKLIKNNSNTL